MLCRELCLSRSSHVLPASAAAVAALAGFCPAPAAAQSCWPYATQPVPPLQSFHLFDMLAFDDGTDWALYVCGGHESIEVARWRGEDWSDMPGIAASTVNALAVFDDGSGPALYAGGSRSQHPGTVGVLARWNGAGWTHIDTGINREISSLGVFDDGTGTALYVGGGFTQAGGIAANRIVRWNGDNWSALGTGLDAPCRPITPFYGDPVGPALYVGGFFSHAGGVPASGIARWDGSAWSAVAGGTNGGVVAMAVFDDGSGPSIYVSGDFSLPASSIARWNGYSWSAVGPPMESPGSMAAFEAADGAYLYTVGHFEWIGGLWSPYAARWNGSEWSSFLNFTPEGLGSRVTVTNDGAPALYLAFWLGDTTFVRWGCEVEPAVCYANCDGSTVEPILNVDDFICFINEFAAGAPLPHPQQLEHYANCDGSTTAPVLNVDDFTCFINAFAAGCR